MANTIKHRVDSAHQGGIWAVSRKKQTIVTGSLDETIKIWVENESNIESVHTLEGSTWGVISLSQNNANDVIASSSMDNHVRLWDCNAGSLISDIEATPMEAWNTCFHPDGKQVMATSKAGHVTVIDVKSAEKSKIMLEKQTSFGSSIHCSSDGKYLAVGAMDGKVSIVDLTAKKVLHAFEKSAMPVRAVQFSKNSKWLFTGCDDRHLNIFEVVHGDLNASLAGHGSWILSIAASPDNLHVASGSSDQKVKIWDIEAKNCVHTFEDDQKKSVWGVSYDDTGSSLTSVSDDRSLLVYSLA